MKEINLFKDWVSGEEYQYLHGWILQALSSFCLKETFHFYDISSSKSAY
jgi:hypothetical protein